MRWLGRFRHYGPMIGAGLMTLAGLGERVHREVPEAHTHIHLHNGGGNGANGTPATRWDQAAVPPTTTAFTDQEPLCVLRPGNTAQGENLTQKPTSA